MNADREDDHDVRAAYDVVARDYDAQFGRELNSRPVERGLLCAFIELVGQGVIADVGCGPGHVTRFLAHQGADVIGLDLSPEMISIARERAPQLLFTVGSMLDLPVEDGAWAGAVALYSIIHFAETERARAFREFARALRPRGWLLVSFHVDSADFVAGEVNHLSEFLGHRVDLDGYFLDPRHVEAQLTDVGLATTAKLERRPVPDIEYPSRRCYLLAQRS